MEPRGRQKEPGCPVVGGFWTAQTRGAIHSTKIPTGPTGKSGPPQKVDPFFRNLSGWTEPIHWVLDRNFREFWLNGSRPKLYVLWTLFMLDKLRHGKLIEPKTTWANQERASYLLQGIISWTNGIKRKLKSMQSNARNCSHVEVDFQLYNEERYSKKQNIHQV